MAMMSETEMAVSTASKSADYSVEVMDVMKVVMKAESMAA